MRRNVYTVGQVNAYIRNMFAQDFMLKRISVSGEVSNCKYHSSGHIYFSLKDETGVISAVMFANAKRAGLKFPMKNGDKVVVEGSIRVYERQGSYQLYASRIELEGAGLLYQRFEELKRKLQDMGMFAAGYKQPVPRFPKTIGVVTAPTGAAIRDIQNITHRRDPFVQVILYPAQVQGEGAAASIIKGIRTLEAMQVDTMIVGRGGGSIEDLWAFNEEEVARAIFDCRVPVISAVGHETDTTIADYVADLRAPTPSAAAELAVPDIRDVLEQLDEAKIRMDRLMDAAFLRSGERLHQYALRLQAAGPGHRLDTGRQRLDEYTDRLQNVMNERISSLRHYLELYQTRLPALMKESEAVGRHRLQQYSSQLPVLMQQNYERTRHQTELLASRLDALSPLKRLQGGYSYLRDMQGHAVTGIGRLEEGKEIHGILADGSFTARVESIREKKTGLL